MNGTTITMTIDKPCKGSVRYATKDETAPITNVYVSKGFANPMPQVIEVTIAVKP